jgi:hypothetical protein
MAMTTPGTQRPDSLTDPSRLKRWTVAEYHRMTELGLLDESERTELIVQDDTAAIKF